VPEADARVVAGLDPLEAIDEEAEGLEVFVIDVVDLVGAEGAAAFADRVFLVCGENDVSHKIISNYEL